VVVFCDGPPRWGQGFFTLCRGLGGFIQTNLLVEKKIFYPLLVFFPVPPVPPTQTHPPRKWVEFYPPRNSPGPTPLGRVSTGISKTGQKDSPFWAGVGVCKGGPSFPFFGRGRGVVFSKTFPRAFGVFLRGTSGVGWQNLGWPRKNLFSPWWGGPPGKKVFFVCLWGGGNFLFFFGFFFFLGLGVFPPPKRKPTPPRLTSKKNKKKTLCFPWDGARGFQLPPQGTTQGFGFFQPPPRGNTQKQTFQKNFFWGNIPPPGGGKPPLGSLSPTPPGLLGESCGVGTFWVGTHPRGAHKSSF